MYTLWNYSWNLAKSIVIRLRQSMKICYARILSYLVLLRRCEKEI